MPKNRVVSGMRNEIPETTESAEALTTNPLVFENQEGCVLLLTFSGLLVADILIQRLDRSNTHHPAHQR